MVRKTLETAFTPAPEKSTAADREVIRGSAIDAFSAEVLRHGRTLRDTEDETQEGYDR